VKALAYVIVWPNPLTGCDEFWAGDEAAEVDWQFDAIGSAALFPDEDLADAALDQLESIVPVGRFGQLRVAPVELTYRGRAKV